MYLYRVKYLIAVFFIVSGLKAFAQTSTFSNPTSEHENNPYSMFGIGEIWNGSSAALKGMANVSSAYESAHSINSDNPASYSFLTLTTYEGGLEASMRHVATDTNAYNTGTTSLAYMSIGIPLGKHAGMSIGLRPYSHVYYNLQDTVLGTQLTRIGQSFSGDGSLNYAYIGGAYKFNNIGLSLGFNFGYMFGTIRNTSAVVNIDSRDSTIYNSYDAEFSKYTHLGGIYWKGGALYEHDLGKGYTLAIGGTLTLSQQIKGTVDQYWIGEHTYGDTTIRDTASNFKTIRDNFTLPMSYSVGVMLSKGGKWNVGIDYSATNWSQFRNPSDSAANENLADQSFKLALGGEYTPNLVTNVRGHYFSRATYRFGLYYGDDYVALGGQKQNLYGVTIGGSFPILQRRFASQIHTSFDIGRVGAVTSTQIQQTYVRFTLGFSFNDKWFVKRKYD